MTQIRRLSPRRGKRVYGIFEHIYSVMQHIPYTQTRCVFAIKVLHEGLRAI